MERHSPIVFMALCVWCWAFSSLAPSRAQAPAGQALGAQANPVPAPAPDPSAARFNFGGNAAEVPAEFMGNVPLLPVQIDQSRASFFVLDSTASSSSIDPHRAEELGVSGTRPAVLNLTGVDIPFAKLPQQARPDFGTQFGRAYEGTLGADFFQRVIVEIDYVRRTVRLYDPAIYKYSGQGTPIPLSFVNGTPAIDARLIEPKGKAVQGQFAVNTALDGATVVSAQFAEAHRLLVHWKTIPTFDPEIEAGPGETTGRPKGIYLGPYLAEDTLVTFAKADLAAVSGSQVAGEIGGAMLRRFTVVFDYPHHQMYLQPNSNFGKEEEEDKSGIAVVAKGATLKTFEIVEVEPKTPGSDAGLQKGDVIAGIDEDAAADLTLAEIRDLFRQIGHKYTLLIDRGGQTKQVPVEMRRLL